MGLTDIAYGIGVREEDYYPNNEWESLVEQIVVCDEDRKTYNEIPEVIEKLKTSQGTKAILKAIDIDDEYFPFQLPKLHRQFRRGNKEDEALREAIGPFEIVGMLGASVCIFAPELRTDLMLYCGIEKYSGINFKGWHAGLNEEMESFLHDLYYKIPNEERGWYIKGPKTPSTGNSNACALCKKFRVNSENSPWGNFDTLDDDQYFSILRLGDFYFLNADCERKPYGYLLGLLSALSIKASLDV